MTCHLPELLLLSSLFSHRHFIYLSLLLLCFGLIALSTFPPLLPTNVDAVHQTCPLVEPKKKKKNHNVANPEKLIAVHQNRFSTCLVYKEMRLILYYFSGWQP